MADNVDVKSCLFQLNFNIAIQSQKRNKNNVSQAQVEKKTK